MRIAYVFDALLPNRETDAEQALQTIGALVRAGASVTLVVPRRWLDAGVSAAVLQAHYDVAQAFDVVCLPSAFPAARAIEKLAHAVRAAAAPMLKTFDVVYTRNVSAMLVSLVWGHPVVYETYRPWADQYPLSAPLFRVAAQRPNFVGAILHSRFALCRYAAVGMDTERCEVIHNGFEPMAFEPRLSREQARAKLGLPQATTIAVYAGRVSEGKGLGVLLSMARHHPQTLFVLVGSEGRGPIEVQAEQLANVAVQPWQPFGTLAPYLYAADVLILPPSLIPLQQVGNTVLPMKLFLYLAAGRAILAGKTPDTAELLAHDHNAWLVAPDDVEAACNGLQTLLSSHDLRDRLARQCRVDASALTWEARGQRILAFLRQHLSA